MESMTPERWQRIQKILDAFDDLPPEQRPGFLATTRRDQPTLYPEVEALLDNDDAIDSFLEQPLFPVCSENLDDAVFVPRVGPYKLIRELGEGGMGVVYLATREEPYRQRVALKLIRPEVYRDDTVRRFEVERQILARIRHPNVAQLYDGGTTPDGRPYLVMEYVEGEPIERYCETNRLAVADRLELFVQVCSAVHLAHQKLRVVHRDLKPGNILVTTGGVPKLLDFGIAKLLDDDLGRPSSAASPGGRDREPARPTSVLTPNYSSPEQLEGRHLTTASDIYSLGVLLYKLLTGRLPYNPATDHPDDHGRAIREQQPEKPSALVLRGEGPEDTDRGKTSTPRTDGRAAGGSSSKLSRQLAGDLDHIVLKALDKTPEQRYSSVERLAEDIQRHLQGFPVRARDQTFLYRAGKFVRRHRLGLAMTGAVLLVLTVSAVVVTAMWRRAAAEEMRTEYAKAKAERTAALLVDVIEVIDPDTAGRRITPIDFLDRARRQITADLQADPEFLGNLLNEPLAKGYRRLGHFEEALATFRKSLEYLRAYHQGDHPAIAEVLNNLGAMHFRKGDYQLAGKRYREALEMRQRLGAAESELAALLINLATFLAQQGKLDQAEGRYLQILEILGTEDPRRAMILRNLGMMNFADGKLDRAETLLRQALDFQLEAHGADNTRVAAMRSALGRVLCAKGDLEAAERQLTLALAVQRPRLEVDHVDVARSELDLAAVLLLAGEPATAEVLLAHAQPAIRHAKPTVDYEIAMLESLLGAYLTYDGQYKEAENCLIESYRSLVASRGADVIYTRQALIRIIGLYETWGKPLRAAEYRALLEAGAE